MYMRVDNSETPHKIVYFGYKLAYGKPATMTHFANADNWDVVVGYLKQDPNHNVVQYQNDIWFLNRAGRVVNKAKHLTSWNAFLTHLKD